MTRSKPPTAEIVPLHRGQGTVTEARDAETGASVWLVSVTWDGGELILSDHLTEQEAIAAATDCW
jgi:folate-dependent phosphoribosylglycinamide formyltransferase PurN